MSDGSSFNWLLSNVLTRNHKKGAVNYIARITEGQNAQWLVHSTPDRVVRVRGRGHFVVFLGKTLYSHSASFHPGVQMGTS